MRLTPYTMSYSKQNGTTLIESIIALLVFSVGVLGIAALQATTLVRSDDNKQRSIAVWKAQELADRIRATKSFSSPAGQARNYVGAIGNDVSVIGSFDGASAFRCAAAPAAQCEDTNGGLAETCSVGQMVNFDVWSVLCDPINGVSDTQINPDFDGTTKLKNFDVALTRSDDTGEMFLYFEWLARANDENRDVQPGAAPVTIATDLCGTSFQVDERLETYCLRFF